jgi:hypothetical protein
MRTALLLLALLTAPLLNAQVRIGASGSSSQPDPSAGLEVDFFNLGFLLPRMTTLERSGITDPSPGLMVFNTDVNCMEYFNGAAWFTLCGQEAFCSDVPPAPTANEADDLATTSFLANWEGLGGPAARYVKFSSTYSGDNGQVNVYGIQAYSAGVNVALNKSGYANSYEYGDWNSNGAQAVDADFNGSRWSGNRNDPGPDTDNPHFIVVDLGELFQLDSIRINIQGGDFWPQDFTVSISADEQQWTQVAQETNITGIFSYPLSEGGSFNSPNATSYLLQVSYQSNFDELIYDQNVGSYTYATVGGLSVGDVCLYRVAAVNICGTSEFSNVITVTVPDGQVQGLVTAPASSVQGTTAVSGGSYTSDGGVVPADRGVCWSTSPSPTIADAFASSGGGSGDFVTTLTGLTPQTLYYARAYVTNDASTFYGNEITFTTPEWSPSIGDFAEGGYIFFVDGSGQHGLVIAQDNQAWSDAPWGCAGQYISGADGTGINTGATNTSSIADQCPDSNSAARRCADLAEGGYDDWYLPSMDEFQLAWDNVTPLGLGVQPDTWQYWTSSQFSEWDAWWFGTGGAGWNYSWKEEGRNVRCIRSF